MWPSSSIARGSFATISCPAGANCTLPHCIFAHNAATILPPTPISNTIAEPHAKRVKLNDGAIAPVRPLSPPSHQTRSAETNEVSVLEVAQSTIGKAPLPTVVNAAASTNSGKQPEKVLPASATRPVSPPPTTTRQVHPKPDTPVALFPKKLRNEPTTFAKRVTLLKALHNYMQPHNQKLAKAIRPDIRALQLTPNQLIALAVEEEEKLAREHGVVYENILKQRLVKLKGMTAEAWVKERRDSLAKGNGDTPDKPPPKKKVDTGLAPKEEIAFLSSLICPQNGLDAHGYVIEPPTDFEIAEAREALVAAGGWEQCDRCSTRFQVFPERRQEDGLFTTGGKCTYHWGKRNFSKRGKNEPSRWFCCNEEVGSPGCTVHDTHVFTVKGDPKRLSLIMPFIQTPTNLHVPSNTAVCFDCEMGYTTNGLEMLRLTVISWPDHKALIDILVRPLGQLLDVNTRFSGITAEQFVNAKAFDPSNPKPVRNDLRIVDSPYEARSLFLSYVSPSTPVLGHALENDLNTIRLVHPTIVDTVLLFPTNQGLPYRHGLRRLAGWHLDETIQQGGAAGHDSYEDARTTGELVRFKIKEKWRILKIDGWEIREDGLYPPLPTGGVPEFTPVPTVPSMVPDPAPPIFQGKPGVKRKLEKDDDNAGNQQEEQGMESGADI